jgi:hypothetical protein
VQQQQGACTLSGSPVAASLHDVGQLLAVGFAQYSTRERGLRGMATWYAHQPPNTSRLIVRCSIEKISNLVFSGF